MELLLTVNGTLVKTSSQLDPLTRAVVIFFFLRTGVLILMTMLMYPWGGGGIPGRR